MSNHVRCMLQCFQSAVRDIEAVRGFPGTADGSNPDAVCTKDHIYERSVIHNAMLLFIKCSLCIPVFQTSIPDNLQSLYCHFPML